MFVTFLIAKSKIGRRRNIIPLEVKSSKRYSTTSIDKFTNKYKVQSDSPLFSKVAD